MFDHIVKFFKKFIKEEKKDSKDTAKERLHLVLMQDRANVSADFMELMKQEIIEVIKKYIDVDENSIDVKLTNKINSDGTTGAPILYANIPILNVKDDTKQIHVERTAKTEDAVEERKEDSAQEQEKQEPMEQETVKKEEQETKQEETEQQEEQGEIKQEETQQQTVQTDTVTEKEEQNEITAKLEQIEENEEKVIVEESKDEN